MSFDQFCTAFGKIICTPCFICFDLIIGSDVKEDEIVIVSPEQNSTPLQSNDNKPNYGATTSATVEHLNVPHVDTTNIEDSLKGLKNIPKSSKNTINFIDNEKLHLSTTGNDSLVANNNRNSVRPTTMLWDYTDILIPQESTLPAPLMSINEDAEDDKTEASVFVKPDYQNINWTEPVKDKNRNLSMVIQSFLDNEIDWDQPIEELKVKVIDKDDQPVLRKAEKQNSEYEKISSENLVDDLQLRNTDAGAIKKRTTNVTDATKLFLENTRH